MDKFKNKDEIIIFLMKTLEETIGYSQMGPVQTNPKLTGLSMYYTEIIETGTRKDKIQSSIISSLIEENKDLVNRLDNLEKIILKHG